MWYVSLIELYDVPISGKKRSKHNESTGMKDLTFYSNIFHLCSIIKSLLFRHFGDSFNAADHGCLDWS